VFGLKFHWQSFQRHIALIGAVLLGAIGTILVDARMYLSAGVFGFLSIGGLVWFVVLLLRAHQENKERCFAIAMADFKARWMNSLRT
jgi:hypothetical protein